MRGPHCVICVTHFNSFLSRTLITLVAVLVATITGFSQRAADVLNELSTLTDQYDTNFDPGSASDRLVVIFVGGGDDPFTKVYDKWKGKALNKKPQVQVVGGFREMLGAAGHGEGSASGIKDHIAEAMVVRYGEKHFPILIDVESKLGALLKVKGLAIIEISKRKGSVDSVKDYGTDRKQFFDNIKTYFND